MYLCETHLPVDITLFSSPSIIYNLASSHLLGTKSIPIKIRIVRLCVANIHPECVADHHNLYDMAHHRHSMQTRLSVEQHCISVHHVPVNNIAVFESNRLSVDISQRYVFTIFSLQNLGARVFIGTVLN